MPVLNDDVLAEILSWHAMKRVPKPSAIGKFPVVVRRSYFNTPVGAKEQRVKDDPVAFVKSDRTDVLLDRLQALASAEVVGDDKVAVEDEEPVVRFGVLFA